jgi:hypothetical protein
MKQYIISVRNESLLDKLKGLVNEDLNEKAKIIGQNTKHIKFFKDLVNQLSIFLDTELDFLPINHTGYYGTGVKGGTVTATIGYLCKNICCNFRSGDGFLGFRLSLKSKYSHKHGIYIQSSDYQLEIITPYINKSIELDDIGSILKQTAVLKEILKKDFPHLL